MAVRRAAASSPRQGAIVQRYRAIDLDEAQKWNEVRHAFKAIHPESGKEMDKSGRELHVMRYVQGPPVSSKLNVSDAGNLAINADGGVEHTVFFLASGMLAQSNADLEAAKSDFRLKSTGVSVVVNNHPAPGDRKQLLQVEATPAIDRGPNWMKELDTHCNVYYSNITKAHDKFKALFTATEEENDEGEISAGRKAELDRELAAMHLKAGDAFEIKSELGARNPAGWNEHYAGIVAVDGADQVTLENYNRDAEFGESVRAAAIEELRMTDKQIMDEIKGLRDELATKWFWQTKEKARLNTEIENAWAEHRRWNAIFKEARRESSDTKYFKMYGSAVSGQSFLDVWREKMDLKQSTLSAAHAKRD